MLRKKAPKTKKIILHKISNPFSPKWQNKCVIICTVISSLDLIIRCINQVFCHIIKKWNLCFDKGHNYQKFSCSCTIVNTISTSILLLKFIITFIFNRTAMHKYNIYSFYDPIYWCYNAVSRYGILSQPNATSTWVVTPK